MCTWCPRWAILNRPSGTKSRRRGVILLLVLIVVRLLFQVAGVLWIQLVYQKQFVETTWLGKASLFVLMVLFAVEILVFLRLPGWEGHWAIRCLEIFSAAAMVVSTVDKLIFFRKKLKEPR